MAPGRKERAPSHLAEKAFSAPTRIRAEKKKKFRPRSISVSRTLPDFLVSLSEKDLLFFVAKERGKKKSLFASRGARAHDLKNYARRTLFLNRAAAD